MLDGEKDLEREKRMMESGKYEPYDFTEVDRIIEAIEGDKLAKAKSARSQLSSSQEEPISKDTRTASIPV